MWINLFSLLGQNQGFTRPLFRDQEFTQFISELSKHITQTKQIYPTHPEGLYLTHKQCEIWKGGPRSKFATSLTLSTQTPLI